MEVERVRHKQHLMIAAKDGSESQTKSKRLLPIPHGRPYGAGFKKIKEGQREKDRMGRGSEPTIRGGLPWRVAPPFEPLNSSFTESK
jgi:hypothetical protein